MPCLVKRQKTMSTICRWWLPRKRNWRPLLYGISVRNRSLPATRLNLVLTLLTRLPCKIAFSTEITYLRIAWSCMQMPRQNTYMSQTPDYWDKISFATSAKFDCNFSVGLICYENIIICGDAPISSVGVQWISFSNANLLTTLYATCILIERTWVPFYINWIYVEG